MAASPIKFGTSGWRGIIADDFTFGNVRIAVAAIAEHVLSRNSRPTEKRAAFPSPHDARAFERVDLAPPYLARLAELVRFGDLRKQGAPRIVYDALHGCGAGYLDRALMEQGIAGQETIRAERDVLFEGSGPDVSEEKLKRLSA